CADTTLQSSRTLNVPIFCGRESTRYPRTYVGRPKKKGPIEMGPFTFDDGATLVVVRVFELRHCLELLLGAAHHGMIGSPIIRRRRTCRRGPGGVGRRRGCAGRGFAGRGRGGTGADGFL